MKLNRSSLILGLALATLPQALFAHTGAPGHSHGLGAGFAHPLSGLDHMLAMLAVGLWAAQRGGRSLWMLPLAFVGCMALGGVAGIAGMPLPGVEAGVAVSVLILGLVVASKAKTPDWAGFGIAAIFAFFHGHAHGSELGAGGQAVGYCLGFVAATILLHAAGIGMGLGLKGRKLERAIQFGGGAIAVAGAMMVVGMI